MDIGRPKFAHVRRNPKCGQTWCPDKYYIVNHFTATVNKNLPWLSQTILVTSNHNFVLPNQDGVLVGHMSFQVKKIICSPVLSTVLLNNIICAPKKSCPQVILKVWWKEFLFEILIPCKFIKFLLYLYIFAFVMFFTVFEFCDCT